MASIFTYQEEPHRLESPWPGSTPRSNTPQLAIQIHRQISQSNGGAHVAQLAKLEAEKHDGPIEYKLHLLLRWRRTFTYTSTTMPAWANQQGRIESVSNSTPVAVDAATLKASNQPSIQTRQARLQQLTTQLLWRLQQSSPFHSSSNAKLVLPVLPEATPRLGVPERPSKLLPGLEESQGALYEIGVADDGTLVGLADEEMEESLTNLRAMAASLGCVVDVHRRVIVGDCEWDEEHDASVAIKRSSQLWVAEVLVRPDNKSVEVVAAETGEPTLSLDDTTQTSNDDGLCQSQYKQHFRVAIVGATGAGKSSLLGTLTTSVLDNGRGKSRLSLLKHRHEIASGVTSSVAQELLGYQSNLAKPAPVVNYASGDVSSWLDIHNLADRLVFLSDSPGSPKFSKSTFRALISWNPAWTILCIPADGKLDESVIHTDGGDAEEHGEGEIHRPMLALSYLDICLRLGLPIIVVITKLDLANKAGLRLVLASVLTAIKSAGRTPVLVNAPTATHGRQEDAEFASNIHAEVVRDYDAVAHKLNGTNHESHLHEVPILMTSATTGSGMSSLHAIFMQLPVSLPAIREDSTRSNRVVFRTDEVFAIPPSKVYSADPQDADQHSGIVLCGMLDSGTVSLGDTLVVGPFMTRPPGPDSNQLRLSRRTSSHQPKSLSRSIARSLSETFSNSMQLEDNTSGGPAELASFLKVTVVSLRNLRLPVTSMAASDTGTVGVQAVNESSDATALLQKARKGMILSRPIDHFTVCSGFTARFPASDFAGASSPPLILGGHAIVYVNSIRAVVKVIAVALEDNDSRAHSDRSRLATAAPDEVFSFEDDDTDQEDPEDTTTDDLRISFSLVNTFEAINVGDQVLIIPNVTLAGPIAGPASSSAIPGFSGFVGKICQLREVKIAEF